ncbi:hypothetical protein [Amycolatopsis keratiniphila]|uniref:Uncharacterized protein n=1 Tax=Amycolatopsis keratiniphila subsp. keratiniphila TaxID=227715 RepID=A0A1W2LLB2_9PSEU|nr:hypothetical protein [Amycolatopsis keratiniphila]ONF63670.1 hypothetical protein AVR91_0232625 [Amycolatopsis keratiniphila subsp. keratiniphila]
MTYPSFPEQQNPRPATVKPGVAVGILVAVIALVAFCITGFAAPGFLLRKGPGLSLPVPTSSPTTTSSPTSTTESPTSTRVSRPRITTTRRPVPPPEQGVQVIVDFLAKIAGSDKPGAIALACEAQKRFMDDKIDSLIPLGSRVQVTSVNGTSRFVLADVAGVAKGRSAKGIVISDRKADGGFCITTFSIRTTG